MTNTQKGVQLEDIRFDSRGRPIRGGVATSESGAKPTVAAPSSTHSDAEKPEPQRDPRFSLKLEQVDVKDFLANWGSQKTPEPCDKRASSSGYQLAGGQGASGEKSSGNLSEISDRQYQTHQGKWRNKQSTSDAGDNRVESVEHERHPLNSSRSGSQGPYVGHSQPQARAGTLSVKDMRIPKPHHAHSMMPGKLADQMNLKHKLSERVIAPGPQGSQDQFGAPDSPVLQRRFVGGSPTRALMLNATKPTNREDNFAVRLSVRALPVDGSARTIKAGFNGALKVGASTDTEPKLGEFRDENRPEQYMTKSELHGLVLSKLTEMYEAYECYIKDTSKDHYNLQPDIELESKIAEVFQSLAAKLRLNRSR